jgi:hypothetical protein
MNKRAITLAIVLLITPSAAFAALDVQQYQLFMQDPEKEDTTKAFIFGVQVGLAEMNALNSMVGNKAIYCQPNNLAITMDEDIEILDQYILQNKPPPEELVSESLLAAMIQTFPCK